MDKQAIIEKNIEASINLKASILQDKQILQDVEKIVDAIVNCYREGGKVLFCGNGGSAGDAQHLAAELSGRYYYDRPPLSAEALHVNTSYLTAVANDYSYDEVYARLLRAIGQKGDILIGMSTSGNSQNIVKALEEARGRGMYSVALTGDGGGAMATLCDLLIPIPSRDTPRIQECHMLLGHTICEMVETILFPRVS